MEDWTAWEMWSGDWREGRFGEFPNGQRISQRT